MNKQTLFAARALCLLVISAAVLLAGGTVARLAGDELWPTEGWATASPGSVGLDEQVLLRLDKEMASGKYSQMMDSLAVFRCGKKVFERSPARLREDLWQGSRETRAAQRSSDGAVQLFRFILASLLSRHGSAHDAIGE